MRRTVSHHGYRSLRFQQLEPRCLLDASGLRITEFLASNDNTLEDYQGDSSDWLEIHNPSASTVDLGGLYLTDKSNDLAKWQFPAGTSIEPGGFLVVFASDKDTVAPNGELHTNFKISADGEYLGLIAADGHTVIDAYAPEFPPQVEDVSYGLTMANSDTTLAAEGATARAWVPTSGVYDATWTDITFDDSVFDIEGITGFGYENSPTGTPNFIGQYNTAVSSGTTGLYVRVPFEMSSLAGIEQLTLRMKYDDGFVAYLNGVEIASANAPATRAWDSTATSIHDDYEAIVFQDFDVSSAISSLVEGDNVLAIHALNSSAGSSDFLVVPELAAAQSTIVSPEVVGYFEVPTPGYGNGAAFAGFAAEPTFSVPHGFYSSSQQVAIATDTPGALIVYTTDGSTPAVDQYLTPTNGQAYTGPITVASTTSIRAIAFKQDYEPSFVQSSSYIFLDDVVTQSPSGEAPTGWPDYNVNGQLLDYGIDPAIIALYGEQAVKDSLAAIPSIALTTDLENLFDPNTGIYVNALNRGSEWERLTSVEMIYPDGTEGFTTNAGLRIRGGWNRNDFNPKHAFRLYFRSEYGDGLLDYPLFGEEGTDRFDVLDLRTSQNYSWAAWGDSVNGLQNSYLREVFSRDTQADMEQPYTRSRYYHLYVDGQYWGLYMTQERIQEYYGESYFGGDEEDYDVVKSDPFESGGTEIADGNDVAWRQLFESAQALADNPTGAANNYWTMQGLNSDGTWNESLDVLLDVDDLIDYMMILIYTGGCDTGISAFFGDQRANNWFGVYNRETGDEGFQFFLHDNEHSLGAGELVGTLHGTFDIDRTGPFDSVYDDVFEYFNPVFLHQDLLAHPEYRQQFIDRVQELMFDDGLLTAGASIARMSERIDQVEAAIIAEAARWGDAKRATPYDKSDWDAEVDWLINTYFPARGVMVLDQLKNDVLYIAAPVFSQQGGSIPYGFELALTSTVRGGTVYYTTDDATDPREFGGGVNPSPEVQEYTGSIVLTEDATIWTRVRAPTGMWSGLTKATFSVPDLLGDYDGNGTVDDDDYAAWKSAYGQTGTDLAADGNGDGIVDAADYTVWRDNLDQLPTVVSPAAASPSTVTGTSTDLSVLGNTAAGEENLTYTWTVTGPAGVSFSSNGDNTSKSTTATFAQAGEYEFTVAIENTLIEAITTSSVLVTVEQAASGVAISPPEALVAAGAMLQLSAAAVDQFGEPIDATPECSWTIASGSGSINASGLYTAPTSADTTTVHVASTSGGADTVLQVVAPVAWYQADATSGTTLADASANGNTGTVTGSADWLSGVGGNAILLSGGNAELPAGIVSGSDDLTIAAWFSLDSLSTWSRIFDFGSGTEVNMFLTPEAASAGGPLRFAITASGNQNEQQIDGPVLSTGQWYHVAITLAGDTGTMYVNGLAVGTNTNMTLDPSDLGTTSQNYLGDSQYESDPALLGKIDDVRIYSAALSAEQILCMARPVVVSPAATAAPVTTYSASLSVLGDDLTAGESALVYSWLAVGTPPAPVTFSADGTNAAKNTTTTFAADGVYDLQATITNPTTGLTTTSLVSVEVTLAAAGVSIGNNLVDAANEPTEPTVATSSLLHPDLAWLEVRGADDVAQPAEPLIPGSSSPAADASDDLLLLAIAAAQQVRVPADDGGLDQQTAVQDQAMEELDPLESSSVLRAELSPWG